MKTNYFLKSFAVMLCIFFVTSLSAKEIPVKTNGTDSDLAAALARAETGDVLIIDGMIFFDAPVRIEKNVKFVGKAGDGTDFFYGQQQTMMFQIELEAIEGKALIFENLGFAEGYNADGDGGVGTISRGNVEFLNCWFEDNYAAKRGGVFFVNGNIGEGNVPNVRFAGCETNGNISEESGAFAFTHDTNTTFEYCTIKGNQNKDKRGSAFYFEKGNHYFYYTVVKGNIAGVDMEKHGEGGTIVTAQVPLTLTMENSAVVSNIAYDHGSAFFLMGEPNVTLINSTVSQNYGKRGSGSWFLANDGPGVDVTFVNVIMVNNYTDDNVGNGPGFRIMNLNNRINIFNSIIARNIAHYNSPENPQFGATDFSFVGGAADAAHIKDFVFKNSIVGLISHVAPEDVPEAKDNPAIANKSLINMYKLGTEDSQVDYVSLDISGISYEKGMRETSSFKMPYYALVNNTVYAAKLGDPALLNAYDSDFDQLGIKRTISSNAIFAGSVQGVLEGVDYDDTGWEDKVKSIYGQTTDIKNLTVNKRNEIRIIAATSNGILGVDFGDLKGRAKGTLVNIAGREVEKVFDLYVNSKGYYNIHVAPGMYILKVEIDGKTYAQKLVVTK